MKFKVGDKVKVKKGHKHECVTYETCDEPKYLIINDIVDDRNYYYDIYNKDDEKIEECSYCFKDEDLEPYNKAGRKAKPKPVNFLLKYDLDEDPIEEFATIRELKKRILELSERTDLKRDSIKVYSIKSVHEIKLGVKVVGLPKEAKKKKKNEK